jgi:hypothetical protein
MKKQKDKTTIEQGDDLQAHYDFDYSKAKPNRFAARIKQESVMVVLDPDVADVFPTSESVNEALRVLTRALQNLPATKAG